MVQVPKEIFMAEGEEKPIFQGKWTKRFGVWRRILISFIVELL